MNKKEVKPYDIVYVGRGAFEAIISTTGSCAYCAFFITRSGCKRFLCKASERIDKLNISFSKI